VVAQGVVALPVVTPIAAVAAVQRVPAATEPEAHA